MKLTTRTEYSLAKKKTVKVGEVTYRPSNKNPDDPKRKYLFIPSEASAKAVKEARGNKQICSSVIVVVADLLGFDLKTLRVHHAIVQSLYLLHMHNYVESNKGRTKDAQTNMNTVYIKSMSAGYNGDNARNAKQFENSINKMKPEHVNFVLDVLCTANNWEKKDLVKALKTACKKRKKDVVAQKFNLCIAS